jgi:hypothetical protein
LEDCNLSVGYENFIQKIEGPEPIHSLLDALIHLKETRNDIGNAIKADIVSCNSFPDLYESGKDIFLV